MIEVSLFDGSFSHAQSANLGGDCLDEKPIRAMWRRSKSFTEALPIAFITDMFVDLAPDIPSEHKIGWMIEPPGMNRTHYERIIPYMSEYDYVLTFRKDDWRSDKTLWYPLGGSWIREEEWGVFPKIHTLSMIASFKRQAPGHRIRHEIAEHMTTVFDIDLMGSGYRSIASKIEGLRGYGFSIVVESEYIPGYFSEKLIDCLSQGTVPIYWGCPDLGEYFNMSGIITFNNTDELTFHLINTVSQDNYESRLDAIRDNLERARRYRCAEDWIFETYPFLFGV